MWVLRVSDRAQLSWVARSDPKVGSEGHPKMRFFETKNFKNFGSENILKKVQKSVPPWRHNSGRYAPWGRKRPRNTFSTGRNLNSAYFATFGTKFENGSKVLILSTFGTSERPISPQISPLRAHIGVILQYRANWHQYRPNDA